MGDGFENGLDRVDDVEDGGEEKDDGDNKKDGFEDDDLEWNEDEDNDEDDIGWDCNCLLTSTTNLRSPETFVKIWLMFVVVFDSRTIKIKINIRKW